MNRLGLRGRFDGPRRWGRLAGRRDTYYHRRGSGTAQRGYPVFAPANALGGGTTDVVNHLVLRPVPGCGQNADAYIDPAFFRKLFAPDVNRRLAATPPK